MISVLIPVYNYDILELVNIIHEQLEEINTEFEIICLEDGSSGQFVEQNSKLKNIPHTTLLISSENKGRTESRQILSENAKYNWLLFLDADVMPKSDSFIKKYIDNKKGVSDVIFGGISYEKTKPTTNYVLRWKYGLNSEEVSVKERQKKPYKLIASANMLIKKEVFQSINSTINHVAYGMDNYFGAKLKERKHKVEHIDNPVYHLGLENSIDYLNKKEQAADTLLYLLNQELISEHDNKLLRLFITFKKFRLNYFFSLFFKISKIPIRKNLLSQNPSINLLQLYRICYMCYRDLNPILK